ncbi:MAG TPA: helix-turn-helix transcriptional regulator [Firmicutes bacterium]|nr:helix-turn-helix transcriptional regulator [Bacillota bacterium]
MKYSLTELRARNKLSQAKLAKSLGVAPSTIAQYETGKRVPRLARARQIAEFFGVKIDDIIFCPCAHIGGAESLSAAHDWMGTEHHYS